MNIHHFIPVFLFAFSITACGVSPVPETWMPTPPAIRVQISDKYCPSVEIQAGTQIAWTNMDDDNRLLIIERMDEQGIVVDSGGTSLLQSGDTFSIILTEAGEYTYFCSLDRTESGTIRVLSNSPVPGHPSEAVPTPACVEQFVSPVIIEIQPAQPLAGGELTVIGSGGYAQDSCGGVNESARSFPLYLDGEVVADFHCYVNHCEAKVELLSTLEAGRHCLSMQEDVCEFEFAVLAQ